MANELREKSPTANFLNESCAKGKGTDFILLGMRSFKEIKGLTYHYIKGVAITLFIVAILFALMFMFLYSPYIAPFIDSYVTKINNFWSWLTYLATPIAWIIKFVTWVAMVLASMKIASLFMGFWLDTLVEKVIRHFRELPDIPFNFSLMMKSVIKSAILSLGNLAFSFLFLILGFIPVIGPLFAFIGTSCSHGYDIMSPYLMILNERDDTVLKDFKITRKKTFLGGLVQTGLNFIPIIGWLILPFALIAQVIGYTYYCESRFQKGIEAGNS